MSEAREPPPWVTDFEGATPPAANVFGSGKEVATVSSNGLISVEQQKAIAEVQARMIMARQMPRNALAASDAILRDCARQSLAEKALYSYARGGSDITGPSIRLAEAIAQRWGNIASGIKELSRSNGYSDCVAYAWDLESGYYDERQFQVRHWRDTKGGGYVIKEERDIYELVANLGQRRKRAVLLAVIPGDVVEMATQECERTLHSKADTSPEAMAKMVEAFDKIGVTRPQIEKRIQRRIDAIRPAQVVQLRKIFVSISDEMSTPADWFESEGNGAWSGVEAGHAASRPSTAPPKAAAQQPASETQQTRAPAQRKSARKEAAPPPPSQPVEEDGVPFDRWEPPGPSTQASPPANDAPADPIPSNSPRGQSEQSAEAPTPEEANKGPASSGVAPFEAWLLDEHGDPTKDEPEHDAMAFAVALASLIRVQPGQRINLLQQNLDGIDAAMALDDIAVTNILTSLQREQPEGPSAEDQRDGNVEEPAGVMVVQIPMERGKLNLAEYMKLFKAAVLTITPETWTDWIELNRHEMVKAPPSTASLLIKALAERAKVIGTVLPPDLGPSLLQRGAPAPAPSQEDQDRRRVDNIKSDIAKMPDIHSLEHFATGIIMKSFGERMQREGKMELIAELKAAFDAKRAELKGKA